MRAIGPPSNMYLSASLVNGPDCMHVDRSKNHMAKKKEKWHPGIKNPTRSCTVLSTIRRNESVLFYHLHHTD